VPEPRNSVLDVLYGRHNGPTNVLFKQNQPGAGMAYTVLDKYDKYNWLLQLGELQHFANIVILKTHELKQHFVFNEKLTVIMRNFSVYNTFYNRDNGTLGHYSNPLPNVKIQFMMIYIGLLTKTDAPGE